MLSRFALILAVVVAGCGSADRELVLKLQDGMSASDAELAGRGIRILFDACPGLSRYWQDIDASVPVKVGTANFADQRELGWERAVAIELAVAKQPRSIPSELLAAGHHCRYDVGVSAPRGVSIAKRACISLCLGEPSEQSLAFINPR